MSLLTVFTAPKPFDNHHINVIQRNAIQSWLSLGPEVEVILVGEEAEISQVAAEFRVRHLADVAYNSSGTPLISSIFALVREASESPLLAYVNADILLMPNFINAGIQVLSQIKRFLIVGQRWDLDIRERLDFSTGWEERLKQRIQMDGRLHPQGGSDYFIFPRSCFKKIPDFAIGRAGWDNWMIYEARRQGWSVINATQSICIVHQDHDYAHLPDGQPHYRLPESAENIRLSGGSRTILNLMDADRRLVNGEISPAVLTWKKFWREVEIFPLVRLRSYSLGQLFFALFHPISAYQEARIWFGKKLRQPRAS